MSFFFDKILPAYHCGFRKSLSAFILMKDIGFPIYADDNTPYIILGGLDQVVSTLEDSAVNILKWFSDN